MKKWIKVVEVNNHKYKLVFKRDNWEWLWCTCYELYQHKQHFLSFLYQEEEIFRFWTPDEETIIEQALEKINDIFKKEKYKKNVEEMLDKFTDYTI